MANIDNTIDLPPNSPGKRPYQHSDLYARKRIEKVGVAWMSEVERLGDVGAELQA